MDKEVKEVNSALAYKKIHNGALLIDIRETEELETVAFDMENQKNIPYSTFSYRFPEIPRDREVIIGCNSGTRSRVAMLFLMEQNFGNIFNLKGGITDWISNAFPVKWDNYKTEDILYAHRI